MLDVMGACNENTNPDGVDLGLESSRFRAFTFCHLAAHCVLGLLDKPTAATILQFCDENLSDA